MKRLITIILILTTVCSCKKANTVKEKVELDTNLNKPQKNVEEKFVIAESGLNYRTKQLDKVLGKFDYGEKIEILKHTNNYTSVFDNGYLIKGEWLGVKTNKDTTYVFGGYLSDKLNNKIKKSKRRIRYLYFSNGGLIGYFSDGTISGCPRCDPVMNNIEILFENEPDDDRNYTVNKKGEILVEWFGNYSEPFLPINKEDGFQEWIIIDYKEVL